MFQIVSALVILLVCFKIYAEAYSQRLRLIKTHQKFVQSACTYHRRPSTTTSTSSSCSSRTALWGYLNACNQIIKEEVLLSDIIRQYTRVSGYSPYYVCICPFHDDTNPSMRITDDRGLYHCFSCGAGGDAVQFVRNIENMGYKESVLKILHLANLTVDERTLQLRGKVGQRASIRTLPTVYQNFSSHDRNRLMEITRMTKQYYLNQLLNHPKAGLVRRYLINRKISAKTAFRFGIGYAPPLVTADSGATSLSLCGSLSNQGVSTEEILIAGVGLRPLARPSTADVLSLTPSNTNGSSDKVSLVDRFRGRLMITITDVDGNPIGFGGRLLEPVEAPAPAAPPVSSTWSSQWGKAPPKYLNSPETPLFKKSTVLFGLQQMVETFRGIGKDIVDLEAEDSEILSVTPLARPQIDHKSIDTGFWDNLETESNAIIIVEGYFDVMSLVECGVHNVVSSLGTQITMEQLEKAAMFSPSKTVVLLLDNDEAGLKAAKRVCLQLMPQVNTSFDVRVALFNEVINLSVYRAHIKNGNNNTTSECDFPVKDASDLLGHVGSTEITKSIIDAITQAPLAKDWTEFALDSIVDEGYVNASAYEDVVRDLVSFILKVPKINNDMTSKLISHAAKRMMERDRKWNEPTDFNFVGKDVVSKLLSIEMDIRFGMSLPSVGDFDSTSVSNTGKPWQQQQFQTRPVDPIELSASWVDDRKPNSNDNQLKPLALQSGSTILIDSKAKIVADKPWSKKCTQENLNVIKSSSKNTGNGLLSRSEYPNYQMRAQPAARKPSPSWQGTRLNHDPLPLMYRVKNCELLLLTAFCHMDTLRVEIRAILDELEVHSLPFPTFGSSHHGLNEGSPLDQMSDDTRVTVWRHEYHEDIWRIMAAISNGEDISWTWSFDAEWTMRDKLVVIYNDVVESRSDTWLSDNDREFAESLEAVLMGHNVLGVEAGLLRQGLQDAKRVLLDNVVKMGQILKRGQR